MPRCGKAVNVRIGLADLSSIVRLPLIFQGRKEKPMSLVISFTGIDPDGCPGLKFGRAENLLEVITQCGILRFCGLCLIQR